MGLLEEIPEYALVSTSITYLGNMWRFRTGLADVESAEFDGGRKILCVFDDFYGFEGFMVVWIL